MVFYAILFAQNFPTEISAAQNISLYESLRVGKSPGMQRKMCNVQTNLELFQLKGPTLPVPAVLRLALNSPHNALPCPALSYSALLRQCPALSWPTLPCY